jgi:hypothetical protein
MTEPGRLSVFGDMTRSFFVTVGALERVEPHLRRDEEGFLGAFDANRDLIFRTAAEVHSRDRKTRYELVGADFG